MTRLSVIIPVYNEAPLLPSFFLYLFSSDCPIQREWLVIDDCSTDGSFEILEQLKTKYPFKLIRQSRNLGKGAAVIRGIEAATGDLIVIQDADFEYDPQDIGTLLQPLLNGQADVVYGSRFKTNGSQVHRTYHFYVNKFLTFLSNLSSGIHLTDMETCYKLFRADLLKSMRLSSKRFGIEIEMTAYLGKSRARIHELPISYFPRQKLSGKKINWKDGVAALFHLVRFNLLVSFDDAFQKLPDRYLTRSIGPAGLPRNPDRGRATFSVEPISEPLEN